MLVYLGGPIDKVDRDTATGWRSEASEILSQLGFMTFDPTAPYARARTKEAMTSIMAANRAVMSVADAGLFLLNGPAFGTIREIEYMKNKGKRVVLVSHGGDWGGHIETSDLIVVNTVLEGCQRIPTILTDEQLSLFPTVKLDEQEPIKPPWEPPKETIKEYHERKSNEVGVNKPYIPEHTHTRDEKIELFLKGYVMFKRHSGVEAIELASKYYTMAINDKRELCVEVVEDIATASLVNPNASDVG